MPAPYRCVLMILVLCLSATAEWAQSLPAPLSVQSKMRLANDYFMKKWPDPTTPADSSHPSNIWTRAVYYEGLLAMYRTVDPDVRYYNYAVKWGTFHKWNTRSGTTTRSADDQCCGQAYIELYNIDPRPERIQNIKTCIDNMVGSGRVGRGQGTASDDWSWVDAIHMAMPVFAKLGAVYNDPKYFQKMNSMYLYTRDIYGLFDTTHNLWWRDNTFDPPYAEPNGQDCFWSRGNGWALAALVRVLDSLPANSMYRAGYVQTFQAMCEALRLVQRTDGFWNVSLLDPNHFGGPELSGTALFAYGMAWGVRNGYLSASVYTPVVAKAWQGMVITSLQPSGFLGYVQGSGKQPSDGQPVTATHVPNYEDFGLGCFLLASSEVYLLAGGK